jgi:hypothetical protein
MGSSNSNTSSTQSQAQSGTINPWAPTGATLQNLLGGINNISYAPNAAQNSAIGQVNTAIGNVPNMTGQATSLANSLASGGPNYQPIVSNAYSQYQGAMNPLLNASLDPTQTPGIANALSTVQNDVGNSVNSMFAGAGRDMSGMNQQALARGISQGEAPVLLGQYNQNVANLQGAANGMLSGAQSTAGSLSGLQQTQYGNQVNGVTNAANLATASPLSSLQAASTAYGVPAQNLAQQEALTLPIAGLGKSYSGTGTTNAQSDTSQSPSLLQDITGIGGLGLLSMFSDPDLKTDAQEVGKLNDGQKIYSYRYKGDPTTRIGLMADEVAKNVPEAVGVLGGYRTVNYKTATARAAKGGK